MEKTVRQLWRWFLLQLDEGNIYDVQVDSLKNKLHETTCPYCGNKIYVRKS